ncbi:Alpha/Beta hydrolase protein [Cantharellus anzutake]|uniref:Alpha/Beta hydrolase protein n=1 Tax=Cantharellus anzutake TaxID=1750568 RepID=UPI001908CD6F|nr:Alpha/Beta hydrolase protein [Cantharellus anzutake]XP_038911776.1 Alpha/Beta hydrolase protein [Cantharellus anzutake]KAF8308724.1 Alpha/Beta hydrolase protein [Cantharellus anzutake]KAF8324725.1 Alpha/Beta hydrolase protein [Cantharellus anzutake]
MGAFLSFLRWLFTDPVPNRGAPVLYLSDEPTYTVRKRHSPYSDLDQKPLKKDGSGERETQVVSMRGFFATRCPSFLRPYKPTWWLPNGHFQTIWCSLGDFSTVDPVQYTRTLLRVPDGGTIGLDWVEQPITPAEDKPLPDDTPIVVILHGLTGGSYESYVRAILAKTSAPVEQGGLGYRGVVMNFRGCAGVKLTSPQMFSGGHTEDIRTSLLYIQSLYPKAPLLGIGFSLGANVLTRYVSEEGEQCRLTAACVMACPWDNLKNSDKLEKRFINRAIYSKAMGGTLLELFNRNAVELSAFPEPSAITPHLPILLSLKSPDFITVNSHLTSIVGGSFPPFPFPTVQDYYVWSSAHECLETIRIPFLTMNALDDPIVAEIPLHKAGLSPWVGMCTTKNGGHLGWFQGGGFLGRGGPPEKWNVQPVAEWCQAIAEDFVDTRLEEGKNRKETYHDGEWVREKGSSKFVGYKVIEVGREVPIIQPTGQTWAGL